MAFQSLGTADGYLGGAEGDSSSPGELEPVFNAMLGNAVREFAALNSAIWLREGDAFRISLCTAAPPAYADYLHRRSNFPRHSPELPLATSLALSRRSQIPMQTFES